MAIKTGFIPSAFVTVYNPILNIEELTDRAGLLYCHAMEWHDPETGTIGGFGLAESCANLAGLGEQFRRDYGTADQWNGTPIDFGELIHWAHNLG